MKKRITLIPVLMLVVLAGLGFGAEPLSEETLDEITAQGQGDRPRGSSPSQSTSTVSTHINLSPSSLTIQSHSQTHLRGGAINNAAGHNQIANGTNIR